MKTYSDVIIVGAGASGLLCGGILAQKNVHKSDGSPFFITILEKNNKIGKKLSATGNGRCNFTNLQMTAERYYCDSDWLNKILYRITPQKVIKQFAQMGVLSRERDGYVYPHTNQAVTVVRSLQQSCQSEQLQVELDCFVKSVHKKTKKEGFEVVTSKGTMSCRWLIVATGSAAGKEAGGDASGYELMKQLGLSLAEIYPALTGLRSSGKWWKQVAGTRIQGTFSLLVDNLFYQGETGEIQIVKDGVSGIPVFQLCRVAAKALEQGKRVRGVIDFVPSLSEEEVHIWIKQHGIQGLVPEKWIGVLKSAKDFSLKKYTFDITETFGLERAQVAAGGVMLDQIDVDSMEVKEIPNLFVLGELLDVDGKCGGYNLHFAWATAMLAAEEMANRMNGESICYN